MLSKHILDEFLRQIDIGQRHLDEPWFDARPYHLEARYTLFSLNTLIKTPHRHLEQELIDFLGVRWKRIQDTDAQYLHDFTNPANRVCISIARKLGELLHRPYLTLIMPSLSIIPSAAYITGSYTEPLNLPDLILSDCNQRLINVPDVLDFAQDDGLLKHNSLFLGKQQLLSATEKERFLSRHPVIRATYEALCARAIYKYEGDTVGAALKRLIEGLRAGGIKVKGVAYDTDSGQEANEAILQFHDYIETLSDEVRTQLMSASKFDRYQFNHQPEWMRVETFWNRLARPNNGEYMDTIYCVELIATKLEEILNENPGLYDSLSYQGSATQTLSALSEAVTVARASVTGALASLQKHPSYGLSGDKKLCTKLLTQIEQEHNRAFSFHMDDITYLIRQYNANLRQEDVGVKKAVIARTLMQIAGEYKPRYVMQAITELSLEEREPFLSLTEFNPRPYRFKHTLAPTFLVSRETRKRKVETEDEQVALSEQSTRYAT